MFARQLTRLPRVLRCKLVIRIYADMRETGMEQEEILALTVSLTDAALRVFADWITDLAKNLKSH